MKAITKYALVFLLSFGVLFALLIGAANIPDKAVQRNFESSAKYMVGHDTDYLLHTFAMSSQLDYMADSITLSIAYYLHGDNPLQSAMWANYYGNSSDQMNRYLQEAVETDVRPNQEYLRYWHGNAMAMRFLHLFTSIKPIYIFHTVLMLALIILLIWILWKNHMKGEAIAFALSMVAVSIWYVPWCLEYAYSFFCMLVTTIVGTRLSLKTKDEWIGPLFLATGMVTVYFDFLTAETVSLLVPLLLILRVQRRDRAGKKLWLNTLKYAVAWGAGYLGMWALKWCVASAVLHIDVMPYVRGHIVERINGRAAGYYVTGNFYTDALMKNIQRIFPLEYGIYGAMLILVLLFALFILPVAFSKIEIRRKISCSRIALYAVIGLVPYVRYLVLANHSYIHFFFTYRAQAATVMALCFILLEIVEPVSGKKKISGG